MTESIAGAAAVFVTVKVSGALAVFASCPPNPKDAGDTPICAATALPLTAMLCGLFGALSAIWIVAVRVPPAIGLKLKLIVQDFPAAIAGTQLFGAEKSAASAPVTVTVLTVIVDVPLLVTSTGTAFVAMPIVAVPKEALVGAIERLGAMPLPESCTTCGLFGALSEMLRLAANDPAVAGENETLNEHDAPTASVAPAATQPPPLVPVN